MLNNEQIIEPMKKGPKPNKALLKQIEENGQELAYLQRKCKEHGIPINFSRRLKCRREGHPDKPDHPTTRSAWV